MFVISEPVFGFKTFGSEIGVGVFANSSVLFYLRDLLTSIIYFVLNGSSYSSWTSGFASLLILPDSIDASNEPAISCFAGISLPFNLG